MGETSGSCCCCFNWGCSRSSKTTIFVDEAISDMLLIPLSFSLRLPPTPKLRTKIIIRFYIIKSLLWKKYMGPLYRVSGGFVATGKIDFWNYGWRYVQFRSLYRSVMMFCYFTTQNISKKYIKKHYFCMLKKISKKIFFSFYQLQQTPTWLVHKYSNHLPGFDMKKKLQHPPS